MKILYFECFSGISGDMTLAALTDLCVPAEYIETELKKLSLDGFSLRFEKTVRNGITANSAYVDIDDSHNDSHYHKHAYGHTHDHVHQHSHEHDHDHVHQHSHEHDHDHERGHSNTHEHDHTHGCNHIHRSHSDIIDIIDKSGITENAKKIAKDIFAVIAEAEAKVHGMSAKDVQFHEVGALDSIVDIVGTAICIDYINPDRIMSSPVNDGYGFTRCQHGTIPVPVPAVAEIFAAKGVKANRMEVERELVTPTGAGIIAALAEEFSFPKNITIKKTGYGAGKASLEMPNVLRVSICEVSEEQNSETATVIETNIDDQTPESLAYAMETLFEAGASDVFFTPVQMKKNRPGVLLTVLCKNEDTRKMSAIIFENTTTIGVRIREERRLCLPREFGSVDTPFGEIKVKTSSFNGVKKTAPEFESAKEASRRCEVPLDEVYKSVYEKVNNRG